MQRCVSHRSKGAAAPDQDDPIEEDDDMDDQDQLPPRPRLNPHRGKKGRKQVCDSTDLCPPILAVNSKSTSDCSTSTLLLSLNFYPALTSSVWSQ